jgi:hypothetical protein
LDSWQGAPWPFKCCLQGCTQRSSFATFGFLAITLALLGTGAGAIAVFVRPEWFRHVCLHAMLSRGSPAFALLLALVPLVLVRLDYMFADTVTPRFVGKLAMACALSAVTFLAGGIAIALAIKAYPRGRPR